MFIANRAVRQTYKIYTYLTMVNMINMILATDVCFTASQFDIMEIVVIDYFPGLSGVN